MNKIEAQKVIGAVAASAKRITEAMQAKGLVTPSADYLIGMDGMVYLSIKYSVGGTNKSMLIWSHNLHPAKSAEQVAMEWIAEQPDEAERLRAVFLQKLSEAAAFADKHLPDAGADISMIRAQITDTMQKLSRNALTYLASKGDDDDDVPF